MKKKDVEREHRKFFECWLPKFTERLTVSLLNIKDKRDIKEDDWEAIRTAFRSYYFGYLPDFVPEWQPPQKLSKQTTIFDNMAEDTKEETDKSADNDFGIPFAIELPEPTIIIENDTVKEV
jgi:hypothetical protein